MTTPTSTVTQAFLREHRAARSEILADRLVEMIATDNLGYQAMGVVPRADLWLSCLDNIRRVLELLALALDPAAGPSSVGSISRDPAYEAARATGRRRAQQGQPLDDVLRSFRLGGRMIWDDLLDQGHVLDAHDVRLIGSALWEVVDQTSAQVAVAYHAHVHAHLRADEQLRAELWEGLLSGRAHDPAYAQQVAQALDLPVEAPLVVVSGVAIDPHELERRLAPHASAWVQRTREVVGLVALRDREPRPLIDLLEQATGSGGGDAVLAVSSVVAGIGEVDVAHRQAALARASLAAPGFAAFDDRLPEVLLLSSPEISERLVSVWVAPLLRLSPAEGRALLETLVAWVACGGSTTRTAESVPCHRNTVLNRLRRIAQVTGRPDLGETPPVELVLALRAHALGTSDDLGA